MELEKEEKEEISIEDLLEKKYKKFYKASVVSITILYIYINENKEIYNIKSELEQITNSCLTKERILYLIKQNQYNLEDKHRLIDLLKFNVDINPTEIKDIIINDFNKNYLVSLKIIDDIKFNDTIKMLQDKNSVIFIFTNTPKKNTNTKRIHLNKKTKTRRNKKGDPSQPQLRLN